MSDTVIEIVNVVTEVVIGSPGDETVLEITEPQIEVVTIGIQGPAGRDGVDGTNGSGLAALVDDLSPQLGGDLDMNGHQVFGQLEHNGFVLDGGLLG